MALQSPEDQERFEAFVRAIFSLGSVGAVEKELRQLKIPSPFRLRIKALFTQGNPLFELREIAARSDDLLELKREAATFRLKTTIGRKHIREIDLPFIALDTEQPDVRIVVTIATSDEWSALRRFISGCYPRLVPIFLSQRELIKGVFSLRGVVREVYRLRVSEITAREVIPSEEGRKTKAIREWTDEQLDRILAQVSERNQVLSSITLAFYRMVEGQTDVSPSVQCKVSKKGEVDLTGSFELARSTVLEHIAQVGHDKLKFYSNRGLRERSYKPSPLMIIYEGNGAPPITKAENRRLVEILKAYPHSMHSVTHANPYAHVGVSDTYDGSSFDVWSVASDRIAIFPRLRATPAALERLIHYVFDEFKEGEVRNLDRIE